MAFTAAQKRDIRKYLGAPMGFYDLSTRLESMMDKVGGDATDQSEIDGWLIRLAAIDTALITGASASSVSYGALKQVDEVEFFEPKDGDGASSVSLVNQGRVLIDRLARAFGVADQFPVGDYFGTKRPMSFKIQLG